MLRRLRILMLSLIAAIALSACGGQVELLAQISETEANEILGALIPAGIKAEKLPGKEGAVSVRVESGQVAKALEILRSQGLPRERYARIGDVFKKEGLISSPTEERARLTFALSQELANTISHIDGVIMSRVHVVLPEKANFGETPSPSSAAVFIKYRDTFNLEPLVPQVKRLVSNSIAGLAYDRVTVVLIPSAAMAKAKDAAAPAATPATLEHGFARVMPWMVFILMCLVLVLAAVIGFLIYRSRRDRNRQPPLTSAPTVP
jgi:type III secretion protein J